MFLISEKTKKTKEMLQYEEETGKYAIWRGTVTDGFKNWKEGKKIHDKNRERISFYVSEDTKTNWKEFAKSYNYPTISKLIREGVNNFIEKKTAFLKKTLKSLDMDTISSFSHSLKEPLTAIKGYLQLIIEENKASFDGDLLNIIEKVLEQSNLLEKKIIEELDNIKTDSVHYDVLIIDDNLSTVNLLSNFFETKGYSCKGVITGSQGIEVVNSSKPKLILLDIILPDISGFEICKSIKNTADLKSVPIFYLTAIPGAIVEKKMEETKADGMILKPFNLTDLSCLLEYLS